jgi:hypothetical protein
MTPAYIPCANTWCDRPVAKMGDTCKVCKSQERQDESDWRATGWDRSDNRKDAQQGHKGEGKGK